MKNIIFLSLMAIVLGCNEEPDRLKEEHLNSCWEEHSGPLPESMKSYELYSWPENETWYFTVITGTNREKTNDEITTDENFIEDGFVKITVNNVRELKTLLSRLPEGESIYWISNPNSVEGFEVPEDDIIEEVQSFCEFMNIDLVIVP